MERIDGVMERQRLYLNSDLNLAYLANELGLNRNYVSDCINTQTGGSFTQYVTNYRIDHAKRLLRENPDMKIVSRVIEKIKNEEFADAKDIRKIGTVIKSQNEDALEVLDEFLDGEIELDDAARVGLTVLRV